MVGTKYMMWFASKKEVKKSTELTFLPRDSIKIIISY